MDTLLLISRWFPYPADNGSKIRILNLIRQLARQYEVDLVSFAEPDEASPQDMQALKAWCREVRVVPMPVYAPSRTQAVRALFSSLPRWAAITDSPQMHQTLADLTARQDYSVVVASQVAAAPYALPIQASVRILEEVEVSNYTDYYQAQKSLPGRLRFGLTYWKYLNYIRRLAGQFHGCTVASERERQELGDLAPGVAGIQIIPNGLDIQSYQKSYDPAEPDTLIYPGALSYLANLEAMQYFIGEIFPLILAARPEAKLYITGKKNGALNNLPLGRLPDPDAVIFTGYLEDVRPRIASSWGEVAPIRMGGGTRLKILEALALGVPVVSTPKGAEGLDLIDGQEVLLADDPPAFAAAVLRLLKEPALRERLSRQGRRAVVTQYDWESIGDVYLEFIQSLSVEKEKA